jgi:hypothetical protein
MKTLTQKNALKLLLFLLILFSAKAFSHPKFGNDSNSSESESRLGSVRKATKTTKKTSNVYSIASKKNAKKLKNSIAME